MLTETFVINDILVLDMLTLYPESLHQMWHAQVSMVVFYSWYDIEHIEKDIKYFFEIIQLNVSKNIIVRHDRFLTCYVECFHVNLSYL